VQTQYPSSVAASRPSATRISKATVRLPLRGEDDPIFPGEPIIEHTYHNQSPWAAQGRFITVRGDSQKSCDHCPQNTVGFQIHSIQHCETNSRFRNGAMFLSWRDLNLRNLQPVHPHKPLFPPIILLPLHSCSFTECELFPSPYYLPAVLVIIVPEMIPWTTFIRKDPISNCHVARM